MGSRTQNVELLQRRTYRVCEVDIFAGNDSQNSTASSSPHSIDELTIELSSWRRGRVKEGF